MQAIIVSLGFGIVNPFIGATLYRVVAIGVLHFAVALVEAYSRILNPKDYSSITFVVAGFSLVAIDW